MNAIELKNFRNFKHLERMSIDGVTLLVGPNNAGKSTITKACRLLGENLHKIMDGEDIERELTEGWCKYTQFDFSNVCGNFRRALSMGTNEGVIEFTTEDSMFTITIKVAKCLNEDSSFADIEYVKIVDTIDECSWECNLTDNPHPTSIFSYSGKFLANLTRLKEWKYKQNIFYILQSVMFPNKEDNLALQEAAANKNMTVEELCQSKRDKIMDNIDNIHKIEQQYDAIKDTFLIEQYSIKPFDVEPYKKFVLDGTRTDFVEGDFNPNNGKLDNDTEICKTFFEYLRNCLKKSLNSKTVVYVPANDATHNSYFRIDETYNTDYATTLINRFFKRHMNKRKWVNTMLQKMGIGDSFRIEQVNSDFLYVSITKQNGDRLPLADFGKGAIQLFFKILHLAIECPVPDSVTDWFKKDEQYILWDEDCVKRDNFIKEFKRGLERYEKIVDNEFDQNLNKKLVIIEEPEQNLHPASQSKLADLFLEVSKLGVNVLVETHSEYLIRRSQVLVAEAKYKDVQELAEKCPFKVYYLPEVGTGKPYDMEYQTNGRFLRSFGDGFYDESAKWTSVISAKERMDIKKQDFQWETK